MEQKMNNKSEQSIHEHDHREIGARLEYFSSTPQLGQGLILWHPQGARVRYLLEQFSQAAHLLNGYEWVYTPHIGRAELWETSGHLQFYKDSMYRPIDIDGEEYYLKPMNCPFHALIYNHAPKSYRDLPVRYAEFGAVYRYELSGTLSGVTRVRGFTQDDAHIICTPEQMDAEVLRALEFSLYILRSFGLNDFKAYIATKPEHKFIGDDASWRAATAALEKAVRAAGLQYEIDEGGGAFYGPKIDLKLNDSSGREWQCSTIQFDFNIPQRFEMSYIGADGQKHTPMMVHRALFGSIERFFAMLVEHYGGDFPLWLAPQQAVIIPVSEKFAEYAAEIAEELADNGLRAAVDGANGKLNAKIRNAELQKIPFIIVVGAKEQNSRTIAVRRRKHGDLGVMSIAGLLDRVKDELAPGKPKRIFRGSKD